MTAYSLIDITELYTDAEKQWLGNNADKVRAMMRQSEIRDNHVGDGQAKMPKATLSEGSIPSPAPTEPVSSNRIEVLEEALEYILGSLRRSDNETLQAVSDIAEKALNQIEVGGSDGK